GRSGAGAPGRRVGQGPRGPDLHRRPGPAGRGRGGRRAGHRPLPPHLAALPGQVPRRHRPADPPPRGQAAGGRGGRGGTHRPLHGRGATPAHQRGRPLRRDPRGDAAVTDPARALAGRRERSLLELPSVARMAAVLAERCREPSWIRTLVASLDRFRSLGGPDDLEALLTAARTDPRLADRSLVGFARALDGRPDAAVAGLAMGAKVWFRLNGVPVAWRPLPAAAAARRLPEAGPGRSTHPPPWLGADRRA